MNGAFFVCFCNPLEMTEGKASPYALSGREAVVADAVRP